MQSSIRMTLILLAALTVGACSPVRSIGGFVGGKLGTAIAEIVPVPTNVKVDPRGGKWCDVMNAQGGPIQIQDDDILTRRTTQRIVLIDEHGERYCGWKP